MVQLFSQLLKNTALALLPVCACVCPLAADDAPTQTAPSQMQSKQDGMMQQNSTNSSDTMANPQSNNQSSNQGGSQPASPLAMDDDKDDDSKDSCKDKDAADKKSVAVLDDENPNDPTKAPDVIADATSSAPSANPAKSQTASADSISATVTVNNESGRWLTFDTGMTFEVPMVLRKKSMNWKVGDQVILEKGKRDSWYKIINKTRNEKLRARVNSPSAQK